MIPGRYSCRQSLLEIAIQIEAVGMLTATCPDRETAINDSRGIAWSGAINQDALTLTKTTVTKVATRAVGFMLVTLTNRWPRRSVAHRAATVSTHTHGVEKQPRDGNDPLTNGAVRPPHGACSDTSLRHKSIKPSHPGPQRRGNINRAIGRLMIFEQGHQCSSYCQP
jgi:hypothetical protein